MKTEFLDSSAPGISRACELLASGEVVALPTETVYGLAGNAFHESSVQKIFAAKSRPFFDPLIVHLGARYLSDEEGLIPALIRDGILDSSLASSSDRPRIELLAKQFWPGPLTLVLPRGLRIPDRVTGNQPTVAIRMPVHPVFQSVLHSLDFPLAAPSANRFGRISPTTADHVRSELSGRISAILDGGPCRVGVESTILRVCDGTVALLRPGGVAASAIEACIGVRLVRGSLSPSSSSAEPMAPGMLEEHYAPMKPMILIPGPLESCTDLEAFLREFQPGSRIGILTHVPTKRALDPKRFPVQRILSASGDEVESARNLFASLRELDEDPGVDAILADLFSETPSGLFAAIADRLHRASRNKPLRSGSSPLLHPRRTSG